MADSAPPTEGLTTRPETCREFFGIASGYCQAEPTKADTDGRRFCATHAKARDL